MIPHEAGSWHSPHLRGIGPLIYLRGDGLFKRHCASSEVEIVFTRSHDGE